MTHPNSPIFRHPGNVPSRDQNIGPEIPHIIEGVPSSPTRERATEKFQKFVRGVGIVGRSLKEGIDQARTDTQAIGALDETQPITAVETSSGAGQLQESTQVIEDIRRATDAVKSARERVKSAGKRQEAPFRIEEKDVDKRAREILLEQLAAQRVQEAIVAQQPTVTQRPKPNVPNFVTERKPRYYKGPVYDPSAPTGPKEAAITEHGDSAEKTTYSQRAARESLEMDRPYQYNPLKSLKGAHRTQKLGEGTTPERTLADLSPEAREKATQAELDGNPSSIRQRQIGYKVNLQRDKMDAAHMEAAKMQRLWPELDLRDKSAVKERRKQGDLTFVQRFRLWNASRIVRKNSGAAEKDNRSSSGKWQRPNGREDAQFDRLSRAAYPKPKKNKEK